MYSWFSSLFLEPSATQTVLILSLVCGIGLALGKLRFGRVMLGVAFVFFVGLFVSYLGVRTHTEMLSFAQTFGLVLFVYALGVEVGPSFFPSLRSRGIIYNLYSLGLISLSIVLIILMHYLLGMDMPHLFGLASGAVTNTPMLAAVQSTLSTAGVSADQLAQVASACAVAYPFGAVGVIFALAALRGMMPKQREVDTEPVAHTYIAEFEISNPAIFGKSVHKIVELSNKKFIISRIWRGDELHLPTSQTIVEQGDHILVLMHREDATPLELLFGKRDDRQDWNRPDINWDTVDTKLVSKRIIITNHKLNGVKLGVLKLRNKYGITITRIDRAGIELLASPDLYLQLGDRLTIVGEANAIAQVSDFMGNAIQTLDKPKLISFFIGMFVGCVIGSIPFFLPGITMPIRLGMAGGPIILGILMGAFGPRLRMSTYITNSATQLIKQLGISIYLAGLGLSSGPQFVEALLRGHGLLWLGLGAIITVVPTLIVGLISLYIGKRSYPETAGVLCAAMANSMALDYVMEETGSRISSVAYATVYPVAMFIRIITAQIILLFFL